MSQPLDAERLRQAFDLLGGHLAGRGLLVELAVYGGSAVMLQFEWRRSTEDVDAVVRYGFEEAALSPSVAYVAERMQLDPDWLNDAVGMYTPLEEPDSLFSVCNSYPEGRRPGLRVLLASPRYLLAMKLGALANLDRGNRDMEDARRIAAHLGLSDETELVALYVSIYDEEPPDDARRRFASVLGGRS